MLKHFWQFLLLFCVSGLANAGENVYASAGFETGRFQPADQRTDAFWVRTLPDPQVGNQAIESGVGGGSPSSNWDLKVVREVQSNKIVRPRRGNYFVRSVLHYNKDYTKLSDGVRAPRNSFSMASDAHRFDFDDEGWLGVSIFVPEDFENETGRSGPAGSIELVVTNTDSSAYFFNINIFVPNGQTEAHWMLQYVVDDKFVKGQSGSRKNVSLGAVRPDKGKWTDFVIRYRSNPFSVDTNPAQQGIARANNKLYRANRGILQIWKAEGSVLANGDRRMVRKFSILNAPVGQVPGLVQGRSLLHHSLRMYKYAWQLQPTSVRGPVWLGFDEFRYGQVARDGTGYADVHPTGRACTDRCPAGQSNAPARSKPPANLKISP